MSSPLQPTILGGMYFIPAGSNNQTGSTLQPSEPHVPGGWSEMNFIPASIPASALSAFEVDSPAASSREMSFNAVSGEFPRVEDIQDVFSSIITHGAQGSTVQQGVEEHSSSSSSKRNRPNSPGLSSNTRRKIDRSPSPISSTSTDTEQNNNFSADLLLLSDSAVGAGRSFSSRTSPTKEAAPLSVVEKIDRFSSFEHLEEYVIKLATITNFFKQGLYGEGTTKEAIKAILTNMVVAFSNIDNGKKEYCMNNYNIINPLLNDIRAFFRECVDLHEKMDSSSSSSSV